MNCIEKVFGSWQLKTKKRQLGYVNSQMLESLISGNVKRMMLVLPLQSILYTKYSKPIGNKS